MIYIQIHCNPQLIQSIELVLEVDLLVVGMNRTGEGMEVMRGVAVANFWGNNNLAKQF